jgi:hypothetical protein
VPRRSKELNYAQKSHISGKKYTFYIKQDMHATKQTLAHFRDYTDFQRKNMKR